MPNFRKISHRIVSRLLKIQTLAKVFRQRVSGDVKKIAAKTKSKLSKKSEAKLGSSAPPRPQ